VYKYKRIAALSQKVFKDGITIEHAKKITFDELAAVLRQKPRIDTMKNMLMRVCHLTIRQRTSEEWLKVGGSPIPETVNVRVFLAAYMIAYKPDHVFENMGTLEDAVFNAAGPMLQNFEAICEAVKTNKNWREVDSKLREEFPQLLSKYLTSFKDWKIPDEAKLTERIKHALTALYQAEDHLPADEAEGSKLRQEFKNQQNRLRYKLLQIAGEKVLKAFDEERGKGNLARPTSAPLHAGISSSTSKQGETAYASLPGRMTNEQLAHELLLDPTFKLDDKGGSTVDNPVFSKIRESFHVAYWDSLVDDLRLPTPCYVRVLRVLEEIRDGVADLGNGTKEAKDIMNILDIELIKQQVEKGTFDWNSCITVVDGIIQVLFRMQAPQRDEETKERWAGVSKDLKEAEKDQQPRTFCRALEFVLDRVNAIRIDAANSRLRLIAPVIRDHGIDYERAHMEKKLKEKTLTLARTSEWINKVVAKATEATEAGKQEVELEKLVAGDAPSFLAIHTKAILSLVTQERAVTSESCPETLLLDVHRLINLHAEFHFDVFAAATLVQVQQCLQTYKVENYQHILYRIQMCLADCPAKAKEISNIVPTVTSELENTNLTPDQKEGVERTIKKSADSSNAVNKLMVDRVKALWLKVLQKGPMKEEDITKQEKLPGVLKPLFRRMQRDANALRMVAVLNKNVHVAHYNKIIGSESKAIQQQRLGAPDAARTKMLEAADQPCSSATALAGK
jgi:hypothetical protein